MGLLNHLFGSEESIAKEMKLDDDAITKSWDEYIKTISKKKGIIDGLKMDSNITNNLKALRKLLDIELVDIRGEEKKVEELAEDLVALEHSQRIRRVQRLEQCLAYAETKHEYVHSLLHQLYSTLKMQMHLTEKFLEDPEGSDDFIPYIKSQFELEWTVMKKILNVQTFHSMFSALVKGEHIIKKMDSKEKNILKKMQDGMRKIFSNQIIEGITYEWAMTVFEAIEDKVHEAVADGIFDGYHPDIDFEYVNRPEFIGLVRESIKNLKGRDISEQMINVFVHLFREWYNYERN